MFSIKAQKIEKSSWNLGNHERFLQSVFWTQFKAENGWNPYYFNIEAVRIKENVTFQENEPFIFPCTVLVRFFSKTVSIAYIPMGLDIYPSTDKNGETVFPVVSDEEYLILLYETAAVLKEQLPKNILCVRFDTPDEFSDCSERDEYIKNTVKKSTSKNCRLHKSPVDIQPPDTTILDLNSTEEELLKNMKPKCRYNIHVAQKNGVIVREGGEKDIHVFFNLYQETSRRDGIAIHSENYFEKLLSLSNKVNSLPSNTDSIMNSQNLPNVKLYIASHENDDIAAIIVLFTPYEAVYLFGASSNNKRNMMPAYILQWTAIQDAKKYGSAHYDFYGIPPFDNEHHPMHGLYRFKTSFGGAIIHRAGSIDAPCSLLYEPYILAERIRAFAYKRIKKLFSGK